MMAALVETVAAESRSWPGQGGRVVLVEGQAAAAAVAPRPPSSFSVSLCVQVASHSAAKDELQK